MEFGYSTKGASVLSTGKFFASRFIIPNAGVSYYLSAYLRNDSGSVQNFQVGIYNDNAGAIGEKLISSATFSLSIGFNDWRTIALSANLVLGAAYWLTIQLENSAVGVYLYYDAGTADQGAFKETWSFGEWPDNPPGLTYSTNKISVFARYTPAPSNAFTWFQMPKSQIDPEKVEESIARLILEHEEDETAHLGIGQSLQSHKVAEIIDHLVASIVADKIHDSSIDFRKLISDQFLIWTVFESFDGWLWLGVEPQPGTLGALIKSSNVLDSYSEVLTNNNVPGSFVKWSKSPFFQTALWFINSTSRLVYFGCGCVTTFDATDRGFGFKIVDNTLSAYVIKDVGGVRTEFLTEITGITINNVNIYRAFYDYENAKIYFYVNGVLKHTETTNFPEVNTDFAFDYYIKTLDTQFKYMYALYLLWSQKI